MNSFMSAEMEHTVASAASLEGTSLHTGEKVTLTVNLPELLNTAKKKELLGTPYFFAEKDLVESSAPQVFKNNPDGSFSITMKISKYAKKGTKELQGVLAFGDPLVESGKRRSRWMRVVVPWKKG